MEALYKISNDITIKLEAANVQGLIEQLTVVRKAIGPEKCGKCGSKSEDGKFIYSTFPSHRKQGFDFYEIVCANPKCRATLQLGTHQDDAKTLFKKKTKPENERKEGEDNRLPNRGWATYNPETKQREY